MEAFEAKQAEYNSCLAENDALKRKVQEQLKQLLQLEKKNRNSIRIIAAQDKQVFELETLAKNQHLELERTEHVLAKDKNIEIQNLEEKAKCNALDWNTSQVSRSILSHSFLRVMGDKAESQSGEDQIFIKLNQS
jgi:hypothetical protein